MNSLTQTQLHQIFLCAIAMKTEVKLNSNEGDIEQYYATNLIEPDVML
jgi:hypothetical protein